MDSLYTQLFHIGGLICHQRPERSFVLAGHQFALCARCTGIYLSLLLIIAVFPSKNIRSGYLTIFIVLFFSLFFNLISYVDACDTNLIRFVLGSFIGVPAGLIIKKSFKTLIQGDHT